MLAWPALLSQATQPALLALAPEASAVHVAEKAAKTLIAAIADRDLFHDGGERKSLFDEFNAMCAAAYGGLKAFVHSHPDLDLPAGSAESFFQQGGARDTAEDARGGERPGDSAGAEARARQGSAVRAGSEGGRAGGAGEDL